MPVLTSSDHLAPKSLLRHRPIDPTMKVVEPPRVPRASRTQTHRPSATATFTPPLTPAVSIDVPVWKQGGKAQVSCAKAQVAPLSWRHHLLVFGIGVGMALAVLLVIVGQFLIGWIGTTMDDLHYGRPRTYQVDAVVGQNDSSAHPSHFLALNLRGQIEVIEFPGGDATHARIYLGPHLYGSNADLVPVTLHFIDSHHDHHPDMIVQVQGEQMVFLNAQGSFHAPPTSS
jgi:hypothetical protein